jgi:hypothetical protein
LAILPRTMHTEHALNVATTRRNAPRHCFTDD